jgi:hypothetical protein
MVEGSGLIVFFIPPEKTINGGILSIFSICQTSRKFKNIHNSEVVISTYPGHKSYGTNDLFENKETIYSFVDLVKKGVPERLQLHVPEYSSAEVYLGLKKYRSFLAAAPKLRINIMNQNIRLMPDPVEVANWFALTSEVTQTTAHDRYSSQETANYYALPTHHLSVFNDAGQYKKLPYEKKQNLILLSPDSSPAKAKVVNELREKLPKYKLVTVENMRYENYRELISKARFAISFGEGFDGYFIEAFFSGGVALAVYNDDFFPTKAFAKFSNTYDSYEEMTDRIVESVKKMESKPAYERVLEQNLENINKYYDFPSYEKNLKNFYLGKFTYKPDRASFLKLIKLVIEHKEEVEDRLTREKSSIIKDRDSLVEAYEANARQRDLMLKNMLNSHSWKATQPLRTVMGLLKKNSK